MSGCSDDEDEFSIVVITIHVQLYYDDLYHQIMFTTHSDIDNVWLRFRINKYRTNMILAINYDCCDVNDRFIMI